MSTGTFGAASSPTEARETWEIWDAAAKAFERYLVAKWAVSAANLVGDREAAARAAVERDAARDECDAHNRAAHRALGLAFGGRQ